MTRIYFYNPATGKYTGQGVTNAAPSSKNWPNNCTVLAPPTIDTSVYNADEGRWVKQGGNEATQGSVPPQDPGGLAASGDDATGTDIGQTRDDDNTEQEAPAEEGSAEDESPAEDESTGETIEESPKEPTTEQEAPAEEAPKKNRRRSNRRKKPTDTGEDLV